MTQYEVREALANALHDLEIERAENATLIAQLRARIETLERVREAAVLMDAQVAKAAYRCCNGNEEKFCDSFGCTDLERYTAGVRDALAAAESRGKS